MDINKLILKLIYRDKKRKKARIAKSYTEDDKQVEELILPDIKPFTKLGNQDSVVLVRNRQIDQWD